MAFSDDFSWEDLNFVSSDTPSGSFYDASLNLSGGNSSYENPAFATAVESPSASQWSFSLPSFDVNKVVQGITNVTDYGLKVYGALKSAEIAGQNLELQSYLAKQNVETGKIKAQASFDIMKDQLAAQKIMGAAQIDLAKEQAKTNQFVAQAKTAAALSGQNALNFGKVGGDAVMLWLTVLGVAFAGIQVLRSAK